MSKIINDTDGNQVEVYTAEELRVQQEAKLDEYKLENPDRSEEINDMQEELRKKEEELEKLKNKDFNFSNLRKQKESAEIEIEKIKKDIEGKLETVKKEVMEGVMKDYYDETIKVFSEGDEELKKKIEFHYKRIQDDPITKTDMSKKIRDAYILATKQDEVDILNTSVISSGGVRRLNIKGQDKKYTLEEKEMAQKLAQAGGLKLKDTDFNK